MTLNTYVMELNEYLDIEWELGDVIDEVDHTEFHEAEGYDKEGRKFSATISMVDNKHGNGILGEVEDVVLELDD